VSEPKRYNISSLHPYIIEDKNGFMVYYEDYARAQADVNELADGLKLASEVGIKMADEVTRLKAEVEGLTNLQSGADYFKAKEGKQS
jgi:hypothetical protein